MAKYRRKYCPWRVPRVCKLSRCKAGTDGKPREFIPYLENQLYCCPSHRIMAWYDSHPRMYQLKLPFDERNNRSNV